jgi:maleate cis-trans isomerase
VLEDTLKNSGLCVVSAKGLGLSDNYTIVEQPPQTIYQPASSANLKGGGGVFISCTNLRVLNTIEDLERYLGKVVISSNQAALWAALRRIGVNELIFGYGKLLASR